jgi:hypothetical protein
MRIVFTFSFLLLLITSTFAQTGKITGYVKDGTTGEPLFGANIIVEGTTLGAASDADGYYVILNVSPGTYSMKVSSIGYASTKTTGVRVNIDLTTTINFQLKNQTLQTQEIVVVAQKPIVQKDVSSSVVNLSIQQVQSLPISNVAQALSLQAGVESVSDGISVRGGGAEETGFSLNGMSLNSGRTNRAYTGISFTSIEEIQILSGGFNAEYSDIRSGLVNVVSKEGKKDKYSFSFSGKVSPVAQKHFGASANSYNSFWIRPFVDPATEWVGTKAGWAGNTYLQGQYPEFSGWVEVAKEYNQLKNAGGYGTTADDITPLAAKQLYLYQHRRSLDISSPDYDFDVSFGGPVPVVSSYLGNLRFYGSFRKSESEYVVPLSTNGLTDYSYQLKVTSDVGKGMKLTADGLMSRTIGTSRSAAGSPTFFSNAQTVSVNLSDFSQYKTIENRMFATDYFSPLQEDNKSGMLKFTHVISPETFYELSVSALQTKDRTFIGHTRSTAKVTQIGDLWVDESPYGFTGNQTLAGVNNFRMSVGFSNGRDTSTVSKYTTAFSISSQIDKFNNVKAGFEFIYTNDDVHAGSYDQYLTSGRYLVNYSKTPVKAGMFVQDKFEYEGMVANVGVRLDYAHAGGDWYQYDNWSTAFASPSDLTKLATEPTKKIIAVSPRLGVSFPITENTKLYFNYGHETQLATPQQLYWIGKYSDQTAQIFQMPNPNLPFQKTVQYELGFDQNAFDQFLVHVAGFYKDIYDEPYAVSYTSDAVDYTVYENKTYSDIKGFEISLTKNRGDWFQGFVNYTYQVSSDGIFGYSTYHDITSVQQTYENATISNYQNKPIAQPFARMSLDLFTPVDFGPEYEGIYFLGDWRLNILSSWKAGQYFTWTGGSGSMTGVSNNVQWKDKFGVDIKLSKSVKLGPVNLTLFMDMTNALNIKSMDGPGYAFTDASDWLAYMQSLQLPESAFSGFTKGSDGKPKTGYSNATNAGSNVYVFGSDKPGDYRTGDYHAWDESASEAQKKEWRKNKSYINMPNQEYFTFLNPRDIFWGLKVSLELF